MLVALLLGVACAASSQTRHRTITFVCTPADVEVYLEMSGGEGFLGLGGRPLSFDPPALLDHRGAFQQFQGGQLVMKSPGHQDLRVTVSSEEWKQARLPIQGAYRLVPDNAWVSLQDVVGESPLGFAGGCLAVLAALGAGLRWRRRLRVSEQANQSMREALHTQGDPLVGKSLGGYRLTRRLGQGGMATVYAALGADGGEYAVKVTYLNPEAPEIQARFQRECRVASQLQHCGLVRVLDFGEQGELLYLVMELVKGRTLSHSMTPQGLPWAQVWPWLQQIGSALAYAHEHGVAHRDLKPDNIMLSEDGGLKILDFGLARQESGPKVTATGNAMGTPSYLAPEQLTGGGDLVEPRSDQYSLGVIMFELLTGRLPFEGADSMQILTMQILQAPPMLRSLLPGVSRELEQAVNRTLHKDPKLRFPDIGALLRALESVQETGLCAHEEGGPDTPKRPESDDTEKLPFRG